MADFVKPRSFPTRPSWLSFGRAIVSRGEPSLSDAFLSGVPSRAPTWTQPCRALALDREDGDRGDADAARKGRREAAAQAAPDDPEHGERVAVDGAERPVEEAPLGQIPRARPEALPGAVVLDPARRIVEDVRRLKGLMSTPCFFGRSTLSPKRVSLEPRLASSHGEGTPSLRAAVRGRRVDVEGLEGAVDAGVEVVEEQGVVMGAVALVL